MGNAIVCSKSYIADDSCTISGKSTGVIGMGYYGYRNITIQAKPNYVPVSFHRIHFVQKESNHGERKRRNRKTSAACDNAGRNYQIVHKRVFSGDVFRVSDVVWSGSRSAAVINACEYSGI